MKISLCQIILVSLLSALTLNAYAEWQCFVADKKGHMWMSTGMTQEHAHDVAKSFCTAYSPDSGTCHMSSCSEKS